MNRKWKRGIIGILLSFVLVFLDQFTKKLAVIHLKGKDAFVILDGIFELHYLENRGAAFGMLQGQKVFFILFTMVTLVLITWIYLFRIPKEKKYRYLDLILVFMFSGAIGNFIDRMKMDYVVDFLYFKLIDFPIFNVADIYVTVSAFVLIILGLFYYKNEDFDFIFPPKNEKR